MRYRRHKSSLIVICMALLLAAGAFFPSFSSEAAKKVEFGEEWTLYRTGNQLMDTNYLTFTSLPKKAKVTRVVSSKPKVAEAFAYTWSDGEQSVGIRIKKTGTVNLKIRVKVGKKTYNLKSTVTIQKHKNLFSSFQIGKTNLKSLYKKAEYADVELPKGKKKVRIKLAKGWKLDSITYEQGKKVKTLKNGKTLNFDKLKDGARMDITVYQEKTGRVRSFQVYFYKPKQEEPETETQTETQSQTESQTETVSQTETESQTETVSQTETQTELSK